MSDILTDWHRECIERGATLLVVPLDEQPTHTSCGVPGCGDIGGVKYKNEFYEYDSPEWCEIDKHLADHCPITPGDVLEVHPPCPTQACELERWCEYSGECEAEQTVLCKLRVTDVACKRLLDMTYEERLEATRLPKWEPESREGRMKLKADMMFVIDRGLRQSHPSFPSDGYVWLVSVEREV